MRLRPVGSGMTDTTVTTWSRKPSCPLCGSNENVEHLPEPINDRSLFCAATACLLVFEGTDREWRLYEKRRRAA